MRICPTLHEFAHEIALTVSGCVVESRGTGRGGARQRESECHELADNVPVPERRHIGEN